MATELEKNLDLEVYSEKPIYNFVHSPPSPHSSMTCMIKESTLSRRNQLKHV